MENCQTVVFLAYVTARAHALFDFRLYLPKAWCADRERREHARVPDDVPFTTKPALGTAMISRRTGAGVPFAWVAGDEVYGRSSKLRERTKGPERVRARGPGELHRYPALRPEDDRGCRGPASIPATAWETRSCGRGCKGHRDYAWAWAATSSPRHWILIGRQPLRPS